MNLIKLFVIFIISAGLLACSPKSEPKIGYALPGTNTAVVGIYLGEDGVPQETVKEVVVHPGQKVLYAGPDVFQIIFKNEKTPNENVKNESQGGVVIIEIPENIFQRKEFLEEFRKNNSLVFDYSIWVNGKEYDPPIRVVPTDG